jgi:hypothetical protein
MALATNNFGDGFSWTGATGSTIGPFKIEGGLYAFASEAAGTSVVLQVLDPAGNYIPVNSQTTSAFYQAVSLCRGTYEVITVSASAISGFVVPVPYRERN